MSVLELLRRSFPKAFKPLVTCRRVFRAGTCFVVCAEQPDVNLGEQLSRRRANRLRRGRHIVVISCVEETCSGKREVQGDEAIRVNTKRVFVATNKFLCIAEASFVTAVSKRGTFFAGLICV